MGKLVIGGVNFPLKQVADFKSEVLTPGVVDRSKRTIGSHWSQTGEQSWAPKRGKSICASITKDL